MRRSRSRRPSSRSPASTQLDSEPRRLAQAAWWRAEGGGDRGHPNRSRARETRDTAVQIARQIEAHARHGRVLHWGLIAAILSDAPGAGDLFHGGFVLYTKQHKIAFGIPKKLIDANGIVSEAVARAMAEGTLKHSPADIAVGVTGVAG